MNDIDWNDVEKENIIELYIKLLPYILRDFAHKNDIQIFLQNNFSQRGDILFLESIPQSEGIRQSLEYMNFLENGDNIIEKIKPIIEL